MSTLSILGLLSEKRADGPLLPLRGMPLGSPEESGLNSSPLHWLPAVHRGGELGDSACSSSSDLRDGVE